jgi:hypothetical protein
MRQQAGACEASIAAVVDTPHPHARPAAKRSVLPSSGSKAAACPTSEGWTKLRRWTVTQITEELGGLGLDFLPPAVDVAPLAQAADTVNMNALGIPSPPHVRHAGALRPLSACWAVDFGPGSSRRASQARLISCRPAANGCMRSNTMAFGSSPGRTARR